MFCKSHSEMCYIRWEFLNYDSNFIKVCCDGSSQQLSALGQVNWRRVGDKPLAEPMMTRHNELRHANFSLKHFLQRKHSVTCNIVVNGGKYPTLQHEINALLWFILSCFSTKLSLECLSIWCHSMFPGIEICQIDKRLTKRLCKYQYTETVQPVLTLACQH